MDQDVVTDPPVLLKVNPKIIFTSTNYEHDLNEAMNDIMEQTDNFESNVSVWIVDTFKTLDLKITTCAPWG